MGWPTIEVVKDSIPSILGAQQYSEKGDEPGAVEEARFNRDELGLLDRDRDADKVDGNDTDSQRQGNYEVSNQQGQVKKQR